MENPSSSAGNHLPAWSDYPFHSNKGRCSPRLYVCSLFMIHIAPLYQTKAWPLEDPSVVSVQETAL